ncbi:hypothetical protein LX36DRAFT_279485 [Colletotrichum falcatum]|nr:hypothetical protein LX36DRAFT_279485 [Colletotrichum falcatum]
MKGLVASPFPPPLQMTASCSAFCATRRTTPRAAYNVQRPGACAYFDVVVTHIGLPSIPQQHLSVSPPPPGRFSPQEGQAAKTWESKELRLPASGRVGEVARRGRNITCLSAWHVTVGEPWRRRGNFGKPCAVFFSPLLSSLAKPSPHIASLDSMPRRPVSGWER